MYYTSATVSRMKDRKGKPWRGTLFFKDPETGEHKQKRKVLGAFRYKRDAEQALRVWREEEERQAAFSDACESTSAAIRNHLKEQQLIGKISAVTYSNSIRLLDKSIAPYIGAINFNDLTPLDIQEWVNELSKQYKPSSVRTIFSILSKTCKSAYKKDAIAKDPTKAIELPKVKKEQINYLSDEEQRKFISYMQPDCPFYLASMIALYSGMRAGEICALRWKDVNLALGIIHIRRAASEERDADTVTVAIGNPKAESIRNIPLMPQLKDILVATKADNRPSPTDFIVPQRNPRLLCTSFLKWAQRHSVTGEAGKAITMHGLRHTFATRAVQSGMDVKSLQSILGHSSASMTLDVYASSDAMATKVNMDKLASFMQEIEETDDMGL